MPSAAAQRMTEIKKPKTKPLDKDFSRVLADECELFMPTRS